VAFRSLTENLDTTTPSGEFLFQVFGALAQYERALIQERVVAGLAAARKRGRIGGRPQAITGEKLEAIVAALDGGMSKAAVCRNFSVKRTTLIETLARGLAWRGKAAMSNKNKLLTVLGRRAGSPVRPAGLRRRPAAGILGVD
jgi:DNA invertase Pin-like site-specific DNA recombinase